MKFQFELGFKVFREKFEMYLRTITNSQRNDNHENTNIKTDH